MDTNPSFSLRHPYVALLSAAVLSVALTACGGGGSSSSTSTDTGSGSGGGTNTTSDGAAGKTAWNTHCASCHGSQTSRFGRSSSATMNAINGNVGGMGVLKGVVTTSIADQIAVYAANPSAY